MQVILSAWEEDPLQNGEESNVDLFFKQIFEG